MDEYLVIQGARQHNLANISLKLPKKSLIVFTGVSGSGKSSLAFDTICAEGQKRYLESLSSYARQFLTMGQKAEVDKISGLSPTVSIAQKKPTHNPRSTVGTVTEVYDYLRLLYARIGVAYSPTTGEPISGQSVEQMVRLICEKSQKVKGTITLMAQLAQQRKGKHEELFGSLLKDGFLRVRINGKIELLEELPALDQKKKYDIEVVVDRLRTTMPWEEDKKERLAASIETTLSLSPTLMVLLQGEKQEETLYMSSVSACPVSGFCIGEIEPNLFSFNTPRGACSACSGLGKTVGFEQERLLKSPSLPAPKCFHFPLNVSLFLRRLARRVEREYHLPSRTPWKKLPSSAQKKLFANMMPYLQALYHREYEHKEINSLRQYAEKGDCSSCKGHRLCPEALAVRVWNRNIAQVCDMTIEQALLWVSSVEEELDSQKREIGRMIVKEIESRLGFLRDVGLHYLTLSRASETLSGGEAQRIRLASQVGSGLTGLLYVLDEPSIGLHQRDSTKLLDTLKTLRDTGNTVIVVEHDESVMNQGDYLVDIGPKAGKEGGRIVACGTPEEVKKASQGLTAQYLNGYRVVPIPETRRPCSKKGAALVIKGARVNNLKQLTVSFPLKRLICVTGVSGSGKSSLVIETLTKLSQAALKGEVPQGGATLQGIEDIQKVIKITQSPIGRTPRSTPATYTGVFSPIRSWFAALEEACIRGYAAGRFSFNVAIGRCPECKGDGEKKVQMHFLPSLYMTCPVCGGKRYNEQTLQVRYKGKSIADVLNMSVEEACAFFQLVPVISRHLQVMKAIGLGYIRLGQSALTLSGGEAQRIKLSKELVRQTRGQGLYIFDEPTTGLHFQDITQLMKIFHQLVDKGNTVVVIEHNLDVIKQADWIVEMGPRGGEEGGEILFTGTPNALANTSYTATGPFLKVTLRKKQRLPQKPL